eukprot:gene22997-31306_t
MVDYTLSFAKSYDRTFSCGSPGNIAGLDHIFYHTYLRDIPYLETIEIPITFAETELCWEYKEITLQITATCESSEVYQYAVAYDSTKGTTTIQYDQLRGAENSTATIPLISWIPKQPTASPSSASNCDCSRYGVTGASSAQGYYSGYMVEGAVEGAVGGSGKAIASMEKEDPSDSRIPGSHSTKIASKISNINLSDNEDDGEDDNKEKGYLRQLYPTVPLRSDAEEKALLDAIQRLEIVHENLQLISAKVMASNVTSQFRLSVLDAGIVEIQRSGWGWGRDRTVAVVIFTEKSDFSTFLEMGSFSTVKKYLSESVLQRREIEFRGDSKVESDSLLQENSTTVSQNAKQRQPFLHKRRVKLEEEMRRSRDQLGKQSASNRRDKKPFNESRSEIGNLAAGNVDLHFTDLQKKGKESHLSYKKYFGDYVFEYQHYPGRQRGADKTKAQNQVNIKGRGDKNTFTLFIGKIKFDDPKNMDIQHDSSPSLAEKGFNDSRIKKILDDAVSEIESNNMVDFLARATQNYQSPA